jgi:hypothetical protein
MMARGVRKPARATPGISASIYIYKIECLFVYFSVRPGAVAPGTC